TTNAKGQTTTSQYMDASRQVLVTNEAGVTTRRTFSQRGELVSEVVGGPVALAKPALEAVSWGYDYREGEFSGGRPKRGVFIDGQHAGGGSRGITVTVVDANNHKVSAQSFDTYGRQEASAELVAHLATLNVTQSRVYQDAKHVPADKWSLYDNDPTGATMTPTFDADYGGEVMVLKGDKGNNGYRLAADSEGSSWQNSDGRLIEWDMKFSEDIRVYVSVQTEKGHRYLTYHPKTMTPSLKDEEYAHHGIGKVIDGQWHTIRRDLAADLKAVEPDNRILHVNRFLVRGSGSIGKVALLPAPYQIQSGFKAIVTTSDAWRRRLSSEAQAALVAMGINQDTLESAEFRSAFMA
ncbi:hypothetical protein, partial [Vibrio tetraodonis]|uniref:hypothetical protein n=1 Tax=Vibrio tetraodonis TaxID=2231647 RepID=UPI0019266970